jgi:outer membrane protein assembly factor BamB
VVGNAARGTSGRWKPFARGSALAAAACVVTACTGAGNTAGAAPDRATTSAAGGATAHAADWPMYNRDVSRTGVAPGLAPAGALSTAWTAHLDGAVYGQPLVVGGEVIAATENDSIYAVRAATGKVIWRRHVGTPVPQAKLHGCGDIFPLGITGTPAYDEGNGLIYAVAEITGYHHMLVALSLATGKVKLHRYLDVNTKSDQAAWNQQRPALALARGRVYASFGGLAGNCGPYRGSVVSAPLTGNGPLERWTTPASRMGAVWNTAGPVTGPGGNLWVGIGDSPKVSGSYDGSNSVTELSPALKQLGFFAPSTWAALNAADLDLGSTQPVMVPGGGAFITGKSAVGYLLNATHLRGIGGQLAQAPVCKVRGAAAVSGSVVYEPCVNGGIAAVRVNAAAKTMTVLWHGPTASNGSPVVGGGVVWVTHNTATGGTLYELDPATGTVLQQIAIAQGLPHFSSLSLSGGRAYVSTLTGITAFNGA